MSNSFIELIKKRRTIYSLGNNLPVSQDRIAALIKEAVKHSPTARLTHNHPASWCCLVRTTKNCGIS